MAKFVGGTAPKTRQVVDSAMGGVLFIDEAYTLSSGEGSDYGREAINTLLKPIEELRGKFVCIIAAPEGLSKLHEAHPDVQIYVGNLDRELNANAYICPGLGDAGDRIFGTK